MKLLDEAEEFLLGATGTPVQLTNGAELAARLRSKAIDLQYNKATEFSQDIELLIVAAAKVALVTFGAGTGELEPYERDVYYYRAFTPPAPIVAEYDAFKGSL